jgi:homoserine O-acetyltransferase
VGKIKARLLAISFSDDEVIPSQFTVLQQTIARLPSAQFATLPGGDAGYGHLGILHAEMWAKEVGDYLNQVPGWKEASN